MASNMSDFIIETTTKEFGSLADVHDCVKNPGHEQFYSLEDLDKDYMNILPVGCKTEEWRNYIRAWSERIVKLTVTRPNDDRRLFGTGCVFMWRGDIDSDLDKFYIVTNEHVIGCQEDVRNCTVEWFYDTEDRAGIETSCGVELLVCYKTYDVCSFSVNYIPETVKQLLLQRPDKPPVTDLEHIIAIAHPHGAPKTVTFGECLGVELVDGVYRVIHTAKTCGGSSGARLIFTGDGNSLYNWRYIYLTHYAGQRGNVYNIKDWRDGTVIKQVTSDTNNINYSTWY